MRALIFLGCVAASAATVDLPEKPEAAEKRAASELLSVWERAGRAGEEPHFFLGETPLAKASAPLPSGLDADGFRVVVLTGDRIILRGANPEATELAAHWFLREVAGVRRYWPGDSGEELPDLQRWHPPRLDRVVSPAFVSRDVGEDAAWERRNGLHVRLPHSHSLLYVFPPALYDQHPDWFPLLEGKRYRPEYPGDYNWQPNLALPEVAAHAALYAERFFDQDSEAEGVSLSMNDSIRFDQSDATVRARGPLRWFRRRPDYSDVIFGFMNRVADKVAASHPGKLLNAYAYYWGEDTPRFPVRPNVVPWLTADRTQWYDKNFAAEDQALIARWCREGTRVVGVYDYLEGVPFLVPRVTTRLTARSIVFEHRAGVRAFYGEGTPHWAFDGPKLWVAANLLWDPEQPVDRLLDQYYGEFWREVARPMRDFYDRCEQVWCAQPGPPWWIKFYQDEQQATLFPPAVRRELRGYLEEAKKQVRTPRVARRVAMVSTAFEATERFADFYEAKTGLSNAADSPGFAGGRAFRLIEAYLRARRDFVAAFDRAVASGGMSPMKLDIYLVNDPAPKAAERLLAVSGLDLESQRARLAALDNGPSSFSAAVRVFGQRSRPAGLEDPGWSSLVSPASLDDRTFVWSPGPWMARGEPAENRVVRVIRDVKGSPTIRFENALSDHVSQWVRPCFPGVYRGSVFCRARVSAGSETFVILSWIDSKGHYVGTAIRDRLPPGDWSQGRELVVETQSPPEAEQVGIGVYSYHQVKGDFAEFSRISLTRVGPLTLGDRPR